MDTKQNTGGSNQPNTNTNVNQNSVSNRAPSLPLSNVHNKQPPANNPSPDKGKFQPLSLSHTHTHTGMHQLILSHVLFGKRVHAPYTFRKNLAPISFSHQNSKRKKKPHRQPKGKPKPKQTGFLSKHRPEKISFWTPWPCPSRG